MPPAKHYKVLPKTAPFKYTNRVFTQKSVSVRSQKAADAITKIIADGRNDGLPIKDIAKKIDTVMGFRDARGRLTDKSKKLIESGRFAHKNGSIYETYRIANKIYELVIKTTKNQAENYFQSLRISNINEIESYINKKR